jgi:hypothetical protein
VSMTLTGLTPATTYHYRLVAKSDAGTTYASDATFTTTGVTLTVLARQVVFGGRVTLSGAIPTHQAGQQVVVFAQPYGGGSFQLRATVLTGPNGTWSYLAAPGIGTVYEASWRNGMSPSVSVGVHPSIALRQTAKKTFVVRVAGGRSFAGRLVQVQRLRNGRWSTIRRARLGSRSRAELHLVLPKGRSTLRVALSVNQAGAGFLGGTSRASIVKRGALRVQPRRRALWASIEDLAHSTATRVACSACCARRATPCSVRGASHSIPRAAPAAARRMYAVAAVAPAATRGRSHASAAAPSTRARRMARPAAPCPGASSSSRADDGSTAAIAAAGMVRRRRISRERTIRVSARPPGAAATTTSSTRAPSGCTTSPSA